MGTLDIARYKKDKFLLAAIIITIIAGAYWSVYSLHAYNTFHEYDDLGIFSHNMWLDIHYPSMSYGFQFLVFGNHISPDLLLLAFPIFYLFQSSVTLLMIQVLVLSITSLAIFLVSRDILKNSWMALLIFLAFVLNPGMHGMLVFDFHAESFIILFYVLVFYFYIKQYKLPFFISTLLLLGTIEEAPFLGITLGAGLIFYEFVYHRHDGIFKSRLVYAGSLVGLSLIFLCLYMFITLSLQGAYASGAYPALPKYLYVGNQLTGSFSVLVHNPAQNTSSSAYLPIQYFIYGLTAAFLFLGVATLAVPITT